MDKSDTYEVRDISLAGQGRKNIAWAELQMGGLLRVRERFAKEKPLKGQTIGMALHITKETAALVRTLVAGGAKVAISGCNPLSTQDDAAAALAEEGKDGSILVYGWKGENREEYYRCIKNVIAAKPAITIDDGCDLVTEIHSNHPELIPNILFGAEETTTGIIRLRAMLKDKALQYPMIAVNESSTKHLFDNYHGTGQSTFDGILRASNILITGKTLVVAGYGNCGKGVALRGKGLGANIIVTEVNAFRALQAKMDGHRVMPMLDAVKEADIVITVTGNKHILTKAHFEKMKSGCVLANAGHFDNEIDLVALEKMARKERIRPLFDRYTLPDGRQLFVAGEGRLVNLACAEGHPSTVMAMSFCNQALACEWGVKQKQKGGLSVDVHVLPAELDYSIAVLQLQAMGVKHDTMTAGQKKYSESWKEGT